LCIEFWEGSLGRTAKLNSKLPFAQLNIRERFHLCHSIREQFLRWQCQDFAFQCYIHIKLYYILFASVRGHRIYTIYSILFIVFIILLILTAEAHDSWMVVEIIPMRWLIIWIIYLCLLSVLLLCIHRYVWIHADLIFLCIHGLHMLMVSWCSEPLDSVQHCSLSATYPLSASRHFVLSNTVVSSKLHI
jgi:hypothetical protein